MSRVESLVNTEVPPNSVAYLQRFQIPDEYFADCSQINSIHGRAHMYRDLVLAMYLVAHHPREQYEGAEEIRLYPYEIDAIAITMVTHDLRRVVHNASDDGHGKRAADWLHDTFFIQTPTEVPLAGFDKLSYLLAQYMVEYHEPDDHEDTMSVLLKFVKDADALDRGRDSCATDADKLNPDYLRLRQSVEIIDVAVEFTRLSEHYIRLGMNDFDAVVIAGKEVGFIQKA